jgi:hypothetical protein
MEISDCWARRVVSAVCTGFKFSFLETTHLHFTLGSVNVPFSSLISQFAALAESFKERFTGLAICATTSNESN